MSSTVERCAYPLSDQELSLVLHLLGPLLSAQSGHTTRESLGRRNRAACQLEALSKLVQSASVCIFEKAGSRLGSNAYLASYKVGEKVSLTVSTEQKEDDRIKATLEGITKYPPHSHEDQQRSSQHWRMSRPSRVIEASQDKMTDI